MFDEITVKPANDLKRRLNRLNVGMGLALLLIVAATAAVYLTFAANATNRRDQMSNQSKTAPASHLVSFNLTAGNTFAAGEQVVIDFDEDGGGFIVDGAGFTTADLALDTDAAARNVARVNVGAPDCANPTPLNGVDDIAVGINDTTGVVTFLACPNFNASAAGAQVRAYLGSNSGKPGATDRITNPATVKAYIVNLSDAAGNCSVLGDSCQIYVSVIDASGITITAVTPGCGNGILEAGSPYNEQCDDGNHTAGDGCDASCQSEGGGGGPGHTTPPVITVGPTVTNITTGGATVNWTTDETADSYVYYGLTASYGSLAGDAGLTMGHIVNLVGLLEKTLYHFKACSTDSYGIGPTCSADGTFTTLDQTPPTASSVLVINITANSATVTWTTDELATSYVAYDTAAHDSYSQYPNKDIGDAGLVTNHSVTLTGLVPGTTYHFRIRTADGQSPPNERITDDATFATTAPADTTPPVISNVQVSAIAANSATVTWTTNEPATSYVDYGTAAPPPYASASGDATLTTSHSVTLVGLTENTTYNFRARSKDAAGNEATSANSTFKTLDVTPPTVSNIQVSAITPTGAKVTWTTNEPATSYVDFGLIPPPPDANYTQHPGDATLTTSHSVTLTGLTPETTYNFRVRSKDAANNEATSANSTFVTTRLTVSGVTATLDVLDPQRKVRVTWTTDASANSRVDYGLTTDYAATPVSDATLVTSHLVVLSGLTKGTLYHYRVRSKAATGVEVLSGDFTFTTQADTTPPSNVSNFQITTGDAHLHLSWQNPTDADFAGVKILRKTSGFPTGPTDGDQIYSGTGTSHINDGLTNGITYYYGAFTFDDVPNYASGAVASGKPEGAPDVTPPGPVANLAAAPGDAQILLTWTNPGDLDFTGIRLLRKALVCPVSRDDGTIIYEGTGTSHLDLGLANGTLYCYAAYAHDAVPNWSAGVTTSATPIAPPDTAPPGPVANLTAAPGDAQVQLSWTNPADADWAGTRILRKTGGYSTGPTDGTIIFEGMGDNKLDSGLTNGTTYYYTAYAYDAAMNFSTPAQVSAKPTAGAAPPPTPECTDSDGGLVYEVFGMVTTKTGQTFDDTCLDHDKLNEEYCDGTQHKQEIHDCGAGYKCSAGKCVVETWQPTGAVCGNGLCETNENSLNCAADCPIQVTTPEVAPETPSGAGQHLLWSDFNFLATAGRIRLRLTPPNAVTVFPAMTITVYLPDDAIFKPIKSAYVNFLGSAYIMRTTHSLEAAITTPAVTGHQPLQVVVNFEDGTSDSLDFVMNVVTFGQVYEHFDDRGDVGITGARVALYKDIGGGNFGLWDGEGSLQANPQVSLDDGKYGFIVSPGTYKLVASKDGYRTKETLAFPVGDENLITTRLQLIPLPKPPVEKIQEVMAEPTSAAQKAAAVAQVVGEQASYAAKAAAEDVKEIIQNPFVETQTESAAPAAAAVAAVNVVTVGTTTAQGLPYLMYLYSLLAHPTLLIARRRRRQWGIVYNALSKMPLDLAIVRLWNAKTGRILRSAVTDKDGRYVFIVQPGEYRLTATKLGYVFPTEYLKGVKEDIGFVDLYHGETVRVSESTAITANIPLDPTAAEKTPRQMVWAGIARRFQMSLGILSILAMIVAAVIKPSTFILALLAANIVFYLVFRRLSVSVRPKSWGIVYDQATGKPVRNALARIFEAKFNKLLEMQITDSRGRYSFLVGRNVYYVTFEKSGYQKQQKGPVDLMAEAKAKAGLIGLDVGLVPGTGATTGGRTSFGQPPAPSRVSAKGGSASGGEGSPAAAPTVKVEKNLEPLAFGAVPAACAPDLAQSPTAPTPSQDLSLNKPFSGFIQSSNNLIQDAEHAHPEIKPIPAAAQPSTGIPGAPPSSPPPTAVNQ